MISYLLCNLFWLELPPLSPLVRDDEDPDDMHLIQIANAQKATLKKATTKKATTQKATATATTQRATTQKATAMAKAKAKAKPTPVYRGHGASGGCNRSQSAFC